MSASAKLLSVSEEFLQNSSHIYDDCINGLSDLDRIIVSVNSNIASKTRAYLLPVLYAYWERFFRSIFEEFIRCLNIAELSISDIDPEILRYRLRRKLVKVAEEFKIKQLHHLADTTSLLDSELCANKINNLFLGNLDFQNDINWILTDSNVNFDVLEKNCNNLKINIGSIKSNLQRQSFILFTELKNLVDDRNKIAHGETFRSISSDEWNKKKEFVTELMFSIQITLYEHLSEQHTILRPSS